MQTPLLKTMYLREKYIYLKGSYKGRELNLSWQFQFIYIRKYKGHNLWLGNVRWVVRKTLPGGGWCSTGAGLGMFSRLSQASQDWPHLMLVIALLWVSDWTKWPPRVSIKIPMVLRDVERHGCSVKSALVNPKNQKWSAEERTQGSVGWRVLSWDRSQALSHWQRQSISSLEQKATRPLEAAGQTPCPCLQTA